MIVALALTAMLGLFAPAPVETVPPLSGRQLLGLIRTKFRAHRPPPPFIIYTIARVQKTSEGNPDVVNTYTYKVWCRTSDRAALGRKTFRDDYAYDPEFMRPAFNEDRDPGPPTADLFEPAPIKSRPISEVPTPEPGATDSAIIGTTRTLIENDYNVVDRKLEGSILHVFVQPIRDPDRNRLRELFVDHDSYELKKVVATDKLFIEFPGHKMDVYGVTFTISMGTIAGNLVVTDIHGHVNDNYAGDGVDVDYTFRNITFPATLPGWYFDPRQYGAHKNDAPPVP